MDRLPHCSIIWILLVCAPVAATAAPPPFEPVTLAPGEDFFSLPEDRQSDILVTRLREDDRCLDLAEEAGKRGELPRLRTLFVSLLQLTGPKAEKRTTRRMQMIDASGVTEVPVEQSVDDTSFKESLLYVIRDIIPAGDPLVARIIEAYHTEKDPMTRMRIVRALGRIGGVEASRFLAEVIATEDPAGTPASQEAHRQIAPPAGGPESMGVQTFTPPEGTAPGQNLFDDARKLRERGQLAEAFAAYEKAAAAGYSPAFAELGWMTLKGEGNTSSAPEARTWFEKGASAGNARCAGKLGMMKINGQGGPRDVAGGLDLLRTAARAGRAQDQHNLGYLLMKSPDVPRDVDEALLWYAKASAQGLASSTNNLALFYATHSDPARRDPPRALTYWEKLEAEPMAPPLLDTKACVLAANGRYVEAIATMEKALEMLASEPESAGKTSLMEEFRTHLDSFRAHRPFIEP